MIASHPEICYIDEPLNLHDGGPAKFSFEYVHGANERAFADYVNQAMTRCAPRRPLVKDPIALMSAEWLARTFGMKVVVLIRHPAAFASSYKVLDWRHDWNDFLVQPLLMETRLREFAPEMRALAHTPAGLIEDANLLWRVCHRVIRQYQAEHPDWIFARHEDLSRDPASGFATLFAALDVDFTDQCRASIDENTLAAPTATDVTRTGDPYSVRRHSATNLWHWKERLTEDELTRLRPHLDDFAHFYPEPEWQF